MDPKGPAQTDFYRLLTGAQGSYGIVTWASVKCELLADPKKLLFVTAPRFDELVDLTYRIVRIRAADEIFIVNGAYLAALVGRDAADVAALTATLPAWTLVMGVGGRALFPEDRMAVAEKDIAEAVAASGRQLLQAIPGLATSRVEAAVFGLYDGAAAADGAAHWKLRVKGGVADILFHTPLDKSGGLSGHHARRGRDPQVPGGRRGRLPAAAASGRGLSHGVQPAVRQGGQGRGGQGPGLFTAASRQLISDGAYFSRPYGEWADPVYNRDAAGRDALRTVKKIVDPNNVLNPSKLCF